jgi:hypothetical protein
MRERLLTSESTPEPDLARNEADKRGREEAEQATRHAGCQSRNALAANSATGGRKNSIKSSRSPYQVDDVQT